LIQEDKFPKTQSTIQ